MHLKPAFLYFSYKPKLLSLITTAVFGAKPISLLIALAVFPLDFVSKYLPNVINVSIVPADSKYKYYIQTMNNYNVVIVFENNLV